jgi:3-methyl-2-oxobutanoate hydroxymethyltransferase
MDARRVRIPDLRERKARGERNAVLTAYDATMARLLDRAGIDVLLVGDSLGMVVLGHDSTLPVTLDEMVHHTRAVTRGTERALVVADMPFLTYQVSVAEAVRNAGRLMQEGGAAAVKIEGGRPVLDVVRRLADVGIPVMGHLGLMPQSVHKIGGYIRQATSNEAADTLVEEAAALEEAGAFAVVLESIPPEVARAATARVGIPTIGIGAGPDCDGQVLVSYDMLGLFDRFVPSFVKQYARLADEVTNAARAYADDVRSGRYPRSPSTVADVPLPSGGGPLPSGSGPLS